MKKFFNVALIIFIAFALYTTRDDLLLLYQSVKSGIEHFTSRSDFLSEEENSTKILEKDSIENTETPGALKVISSVFSTTPDKSNLSTLGVLQWTNNERSAAGVSPLKEDSRLNKSAKKKLDDMFINQYFEHVSPKGIGVGDLGEGVGYEYILIGENLALGNFRNDQAVVEAWMESPGHRANILNQSYTEIGIAVGRGEYEGNNVWIAVQHFGLPKSICPETDDVLKNQIEADQNIINKLDKNLTQMDKEIKSNRTSDNINDYNKLVGEYNNILNQIKKNIETYNSQVKDFNTCVSKSIKN